jgi:hypothetical protein
MRRGGGVSDDSFGGKIGKQGREKRRKIEYGRKGKQGKGKMETKKEKNVN